MKNKIIKWLGLKTDQSELNEIIKKIETLQSQNLQHTSDLARLMLDVKAGFISWNSFNFVCRLNLNMENYKKHIPLDMIQNINRNK